MTDGQDPATPKTQAPDRPKAQGGTDSPNTDSPNDAAPDRSGDECLARVRAILEASRRQALQAVNTAMVRAYWLVGREIVEEEQRGRGRAEYGMRLIEQLAASLTRDFG